MSVRVLVFMADANWGGPHNRMVQITPGLVARGYEVIIALPEESGNAEAHYAASGITIRKLPIHRLRRYSSPFRNIFGNLLNLFRMTSDVKNLRQLIRDEKIDIVQVSGVMSIQAGVAAWLERRPIVWQILGLVTPRLLMLVYMPFIVASSAVIMSVGRSVAARHFLVNRYARRIIYFLPPINITRFKPDTQDRKRVRKLLEYVPSDHVVGIVGNRNYAKGHDYFVHIAGRCRDRGLPFKFVAVGRDTPGSTDYYKTHVIEVAEKKGLLQDGTLRFIEPKFGIESYLRAFDPFALTSRIEGTPTVLLEAMATGLPTISYDVGSVPEVLNEECGRIVDIGGVDRFCDLLEEFWTKPVLAQKLGASAREAAERGFGVDLSTQKHITAYRHALKLNSDLPETPT